MKTFITFITSWVRTEDLLEKEIATHSSILAWRILWTEEPSGLQSMGSQSVRHNWTCAHTHTHTHTHTHKIPQVWLIHLLWGPTGQSLAGPQPIRTRAAVWIRKRYSFIQADIFSCSHRLASQMRDGFNPICPLSRPLCTSQPVI